MLRPVLVIVVEIQLNSIFYDLFGHVIPIYDVQVLHLFGHGLVYDFFL